MFTYFTCCKVIQVNNKQLYRVIIQKNFNIGA